MASLTVNFIGICTHVQDRELTGVRHRVVLVNGIVPQPINGHPIATHVSAFFVRQSDVLETNGIRLPAPTLDGFVALPLAGVAFSINNASPVPPNDIFYSDQYKTGIPSLKKLTPNLPPLSMTTVTGRDPLLAACYVDVEAGSFDVSVTGLDPDGALYAVLTTNVSDDNPILNLSSFVWNNATITLRSGAEISFTNVGVGDHADSDADFLLHYRVLESIPAGATSLTQLPRGVKVKPPRPPLGQNIGPGCSNSNYP